MSCQTTRLQRAQPRNVLRERAVEPVVVKGLLHASRIFECLRIISTTQMQERMKIQGLRSACDRRRIVSRAEPNKDLKGWQRGPKRVCTPRLLQHSEGVFESTDRGIQHRKRNISSYQFRCQQPR